MRVFNTEKTVLRNRRRFWQFRAPCFANALPRRLRKCDKEKKRMATALRLRRLAVVGGLATVVAAGLFVTVTNAEAATVFSADFESGSTSGWSKSGGTWAIVSDGSQVFQQSDSGSERAREFAGDTG